MKITKKTERVWDIKDLTIELNKHELAQLIESGTVRHKAIEIDTETFYTIKVV